MVLVEALKADGVQTSIHYPPIQGFTAYRDVVEPTPLAELICSRELTLPLYPTMKDSDLDLVCASLVANLKKAQIL
jgi:dTDP-4-amino-4,6-dideoxygalactose transaminase